MENFRATPQNLISLPRRINRLSELAYNLWWSWNPEAERLFKLIDTDLWETVGHNPVRFLQKLERSQILSLIHISTTSIRVNGTLPRMTCRGSEKSWVRELRITWISDW